ncbi:MAG: hypothetical protein ACI30K_00555 [Muribaculaceae bacterium]
MNYYEFLAFEEKALVSVELSFIDGSLAQMMPQPTDCRLSETNRE